MTAVTDTLDEHHRRPLQPTIGAEISGVDLRHPLE